MNYEDQFQKRYQDTLAKLAEGTAAGQSPDEVFKMIQTASVDKGNPTFREVQADMGNLPMGSGNISAGEMETVERYTPEQRMQMDLGKPLSEITEQERRSWMAMDRENNMAIGSGSLTEEEIKALSYRMDPMMRPMGSGSMSDEEVMIYKDSGMVDPMTGTGAIGELPSSVEGFLGNLRRKIGE